MHNKAVIRTLGAPLGFFDGQSSGRIIGPLGSDLSNIDGIFSELGEVVIQFFASLAAIFIVL